MVKVEEVARPVSRTPQRARPRRRVRNPLPGLLGLVWLVVVVYPIFYMLVTSLRTQRGFLGGAPWTLPNHPTLGNYASVLRNGFGLYLINSAVVTVLSVTLMAGTAILAAYAIVRLTGRTTRLVFSLFIFGLAIPVQAAIIPIYLIITSLGLYDTLWAMILPYAAFGIPLTVLILVNFIRDIPRTLYEAMVIDGAGHLTILRRLIVPLSRPALITVSIYQVIQVWNGFIFPLILTQSPNVRVLPLALWNFRGQYTINVPAILAAVFLSSLPILILYVIGRRQLVSGLIAGFSR
ncbi:MAG: carbohydrate ABC transporter permease [Streptosporangiaceae bacterium]